MNVLPAEVSNGKAQFAGKAINVENARGKLPEGKRLEFGVRPEFVSLSKKGIPVDITKVSDTGRNRIVAARHGDTQIHLLVGEDTSIPSGRAHVTFDPGHTRLYADGWLVGRE
jgi:glycerol transport system ATP-binding protein